MTSEQKLTNYQQVVEFNTAFGVETNAKPQMNLFKEDPKLVNYRLSLINEEVAELREAIETSDFVETIDALSDILYVTYGAFTAFGIDADKAFRLVHESNMSKLCKTEKEAQDTVEWYKTNEASRYDSPSYRLSDDKVHYVVYNVNTKKILKSINYLPVQFTSLKLRVPLSGTD